MLLVQLGINSTRDVWKFCQSNAFSQNYTKIANRVDQDRFVKIAVYMAKIRKSLSIF